MISIIRMSILINQVKVRINQVTSVLCQDCQEVPNTDSDNGLPER